MALYVNMNKEPKKKVSLLGWCFSLSVFFHVALGFYHIRSSLGLDPQATPDSSQLIELSQLPKSNLQARAQEKNAPKLSPEQQIAETEDAHNREIDPNAKFLGEHNQRANRQTRAKRTDDFRSKKGTGGREKTKDLFQVPPTGDTSAPSETPDEPINGYSAQLEAPKNGIKRNWKTLSLKDLGVNGNGGAEAATDDALREVRDGEGTVLSTREFRFYSYYHRIKELLRQYWRPNVERQITRIWQKGKNIKSDELTTRVLVLLDDSGKIRKISKLSSSGFMELDEAAVEAFQKAAPFPNPPKGMVDADGFVRIRWDFILQTDTGPAIQWRSYGAMPN